MVNYGSGESPRKHKKIAQIEEARKIKERFPAMSITKIAKLVDLNPTTLYTCQWYRTIKPVRGYEDAPSRTAELSGAVKSARPKIAQYGNPLASEEEFTTQRIMGIVDALNQVAKSQQDILNLLARLV